MTPVVSTSTDTESIRRALHVILPPYAVILYNDDVHSMDLVVAVLLKSVPTLGMEEATAIMFEAHNSGQAVVVRCPLEHAELYRDRLRGFGLGSMIERA